MKINPIDNYILLKEKPLAQQVVTGVALPEETDMDRPDIGIVVSFGENVRSNLKQAGLQVIFQRHLFTQLFLDGIAPNEKIWLGQDIAVIATIEE